MAAYERYRAARQRMVLRTRGALINGVALHDTWIDIVVGAREFLRERNFPLPYRWAHFYVDHGDVFRAGALTAARHIASALQAATDALHADWRRWEELDDVARSYQKRHSEPPASSTDRVAAFERRYGSLCALERALGECEYYVRAFTSAGLGGKTRLDTLVDASLSAFALLASLLVAATCAVLVFASAIMCALLTQLMLGVLKDLNVIRFRARRNPLPDPHDREYRFFLGGLALCCLGVWTCDTLLRNTSPLGDVVATFLLASHHPLVWACMGLPYAYALYLTR